MRFFKAFIFLITVLLLNACSTNKKISSSTFEISKKEIANMMHQQSKDWSNGDIEAFMQGYLKSDSLKFVGSKGLTYGWQQTLENYKKGYPTKDHMGTLSFDLLEFDQLTDNIFFVVGKYNLKRKVGDARGYFSLILKKIDGEWKIIADHSS